MPDVKHHSYPFAVAENELQKVEQFCKDNQLDEIGHICAELRVLRAEYLAQANRISKQRAMIEMLEHDPTVRYSKELDSMTTTVRESKNAASVP